jgi:hypothetical protein
MIGCWTSARISRVWSAVYSEVRIVSPSPGSQSPEATADGKTPVALARPVTLGAAHRRIDRVVRSAFGVT